MLGSEDQQTKTKSKKQTNKKILIRTYHPVTFLQKIIVLTPLIEILHVFIFYHLTLILRNSFTNYYSLRRKMFHKIKSKHLYQKLEMLNSNKILETDYTLQGGNKDIRMLKKYPPPLRETQCQNP